MQTMFLTKEVSSLDEAIGSLDILYMTRVQKERFFNEEDYIRLKDCYILDNTKMAEGKTGYACFTSSPSCK